MATRQDTIWGTIVIAAVLLAGSLFLVNSVNHNTDEVKAATEKLEKGFLKDFPVELGKVLEKSGLSDRDRKELEDLRAFARSYEMFIRTNPNSYPNAPALPPVFPRYPYRPGNLGSPVGSTEDKPVGSTEQK